MKKHHPADRTDMRAVKPSRRARLEALLFAGAALGTTVLTLAATVDPKLPLFRGD
jgi:hypothetical protein